METRRSRRSIWRITAIALVALLLAGKAVWGWGRIGHRVSARLAESRLSPTALAAVRNLLDGQSLVEIADWADQQREVPRTGPWHYVNVPISEFRYDPKYCPAGGCVVSNIEDFERVLRDPKAIREEKQQALKFLIHFVEDLHQPLHVGDTGTHGGNLVQVRFFDLRSNLHRV